MLGHYFNISRKKHSYFPELHHGLQLSLTAVWLDARTEDERKIVLFSFTLARNLVLRKISALPFIRLSVGPVDVLGLVALLVTFS